MKPRIPAALMLLFLLALNGSSRIAHAQCADWRDGPFRNNASDVVRAMAVFNGEIVAGGLFTQTLDSGGSAQSIGAFDGASMHAFGSGILGEVNALKSFTYPGVFGNNELIAGGQFVSAGGTPANSIARWVRNPISVVPPPAWATMGPGFNSAVNAIERFNNASYAAGRFTASGATSANRIARWNESAKLWEPLGSGLNEEVLALCAYNGFLYAGGIFTTAGGITTGGLARWNGTAWSQVGGNFVGTVSALTVHNGLLVIGGTFTGLNNSPNLAWYNGTSYGTFGSNQGTNAPIRSLHSTGGRLYIGGEFTSIGSQTVNHVAYNENGSWFPMNGGTSASVQAIAHYHNIVHVGGLFQFVRGSSLPSDTWALFDETGGPQIRSNPAAVNANHGDNVSFTCLPDTGYTGLTLQWKLNGVPLAEGPTNHGSTISGAHREVLNVLNVGVSDMGDYTLTVSNACTSVTSSAAALTSNVGVAALLPHANTFDAIAPNPARHSANIAFSLAREARVRIRVQDIAGRTIRSLDAGVLAAGQHSLLWDMRSDDDAVARPGLYFVALDVNGKRLDTHRLAVIH